MKYNFLNIPFCNIHAQPSTKSEISSQILYGEKFRILNKKKIGLEYKHLLIDIKVL